MGLIRRFFQYPKGQDGEFKLDQGTVKTLNISVNHDTT